MAAHSSILAWKIPGMEESGGLQSRVLQAVRQDLASEHTVLTLRYMGIT